MYSIDYDDEGNPVSGEYLGSGTGTVGVGSGSGGTSTGGTSTGGTGTGGTGGTGTTGTGAGTQGAGGAASGGTYNLPQYTVNNLGLPQSNGYVPGAQFSGLVTDDSGMYVPSPNLVSGATAITDIPGYTMDETDYYTDAPSMQNWLMQNAQWDPNDPYKASILPNQVPGDVMTTSYDYTAQNATYSPSPEDYAIAAGNSTMLTPYGNYTPEQLAAIEADRNAKISQGLIYDYESGSWVDDWRYEF